MTIAQQARPSIEGIVPVMLTPFDDSGAIDYAGLERLIEWYIAHGSDALFAVAQSSEMQFLTLAERSALGRFVVEKVAGRIPVVVSGHISDDPAAQAEELSVAAATGAQGVVLVTNRLDPAREGTRAFAANLERLLARLPADVPLGLYECPAPYRRLLSDDELKLCIDTGHFIMLKDGSCDLPTVKRRVALACLLIAPPSPPPPLPPPASAVPPLPPMAWLSVKLELKTESLPLLLIAPRKVLAFAAEQFFEHGVTIVGQQSFEGEAFRGEEPLGLLFL